jgi:hypothetical protein
MRLQDSSDGARAALAVLLACLATVAGCDTAAATKRTPESRPAERVVPQRDAERGAAGGDARKDAGAEPRDGERSQPPGVPRDELPTRPATQPAAASQPATSTAAADLPAPKLPDYLIILKRFDELRPVDAQARTEGDHRLIIQTENVRRIRIDRKRLPLRRDRSISLQLDGQGIEWLASSPVDEFERSNTGEWKAVTGEP